MKNIKDKAINLFNIIKYKKCRCEAAHEVCLGCNQCHLHKKKQIIEDFEDLNQYIDHTLLRADTQTQDIIKLCQEAEKYSFKSVCIHPSFIITATKYLESATICSVVGFPLGGNTTDTKFYEVSTCVDLGAREIDMVVNISNIKEGNNVAVHDEISMIAEYCSLNHIILKIIIETCLLTTEEIIRVCLIAKKAGAHFIKTSTGFSSKGAEEETVKLIRDVVGSYLGVKASGGIKTREDALKMLKAGANRIGTSSSIEIIS